MKALYTVVNTKRRPPWPHSMQSYPVSATLSFIEGADSHYGEDAVIYKVVCRYERHNGETRVETTRFWKSDLREARAHCRELIRGYIPQAKPNILTLGEPCKP